MTEIYPWYDHELRMMRDDIWPFQKVDRWQVRIDKATTFAARIKRLRDMTPDGWTLRFFKKQRLDFTIKATSRVVWVPYPKSRNSFGFGIAALRLASCLHNTLLRSPSDWRNNSAIPALHPDIMNRLPTEGYNYYRTPYQFRLLCDRYIKKYGRVFERLVECYDRELMRFLMTEAAWTRNKYGPVPDRYVEYTCGRVEQIFARFNQYRETTHGGQLYYAFRLPSKAHIRKLNLEKRLERLRKTAAQKGANQPPF